jgi:Mn2+/Fe2+ NRAMP family transporter
MLLSNVVMYFLILTTAATLNAHGHKDIETAKQAAEALRPLAGAGAYWLFTLGMIGTNTFGPPAVTDAGFSYDDLFGLMGTHQQCARTP